MQLLNFLDVDDSSGYFEPAFRQVMEEHLELIRTAGSPPVLSIPPILALRFQGDYFGLLENLGVPVYLQWITMRVNGLTSPLMADKDITIVNTVDVTFIRRLYTTHRTHSKVKKATLR